MKKKNHKTIVKVTDLIIQAWIYSLMGLTIQRSISQGVILGSKVDEVVEVLNIVINEGL